MTNDNIQPGNPAFHNWAGTFAGIVSINATAWGRLRNVSPRVFLCAVVLLALAAVGPLARAAELAGWDVFGQYGFGVSPMTPTTVAANLTIGGLTRGSGVFISGTGAGNVWGGVGVKYIDTEADAIATNEFVTFSITANAGSTVSCTTIPAYNIRRSGTGISTGIWQYQVGTGAFIDIGSAITWGTKTTSAGNPESAIDLSGISALQNVASGTTITFRLVLWGDTGATGTWYINDLAVTGDDLQVQGTVITPTITGAATATAFATTYGTASAAQTFPVSGSSLTANIIATAPTGYEVSSDGTTYGGTATFTQCGGSAGGTLHLRLATTAAVSGTYDSQNIALNSAGAATVNITTATSGDVVSPALLTLAASADSKNYGGTKTYGSGSSAYSITSGALQDSDAISTVTLTDTDGGGAATAAAGGTYPLTPGALVFTTGSAANYTITYTAGLLTVSPLAASVTANAKSKNHGDANPALTATVAGTVNSDTLNYTLATDATQFSCVGVSNIMVTLGGNPNYNVTKSNSTLSINQATPAFNLVSSANPSGYNAGVTFTNSTLLADLTGIIQFNTNGANFGSAVAISGGSAVSPTTTGLPRGTTNVIQAIYSGDANYLPGTNTLIQGVTNHPPAATGNTYYRNGMNCWKIATSVLLTNASDVDGDALTLISLGVSTNGITLDAASNPGYVQYANPNHACDQFTYTVADGYGGTNTAIITLAFSLTGALTGTNSITQIMPGNPTTLMACGAINFSYILQRSVDMVNWVEIQTNLAVNGLVNATDGFGDLGGHAPASAFYRFEWDND